jgi:hypothetical protein
MFRIAYEGFLVTAKGTSRQEHRLNTTILDRLESIALAEPDLVIPGFNPADPASPKIHYLDTARDGVVIFEDAEFEYFRQTLEKIQGPAMLSRLISSLFDFVDGAEKGDAKTLAQAR